MTEYRTPGQIADSRRWYFIRATGEAVPEVWVDLRSQVQPTYTLALENTPQHTSRYAHALLGVYSLSSQINARTPVPFGHLAELLAVWGARWNLTPEWCERYALSTLRFWNARPDYSKPSPFSLGSSYIDPRPMLRPETPKEIQGANAKRIEEGWKIYKSVDERQWRWLALYQCRGLSPSKVDGKVKADTVAKGVSQAAGYIDLPLRIGARGPRLS